MAEEIEDIGVKIAVNKTEAKWLEVRSAQEDAIITAKMNQEIGELVIELADKKIAAEQKV